MIIGSDQIAPKKLLLLIATDSPGALGEFKTSPAINCSAILHHLLLSSVSLNAVMNSRISNCMDPQNTSHPRAAWEAPRARYALIASVGMFMLLRFLTTIPLSRDLFLK